MLPEWLLCDVKSNPTLDKRGIFGKNLGKTFASVCWFKGFYIWLGHQAGSEFRWFLRQAIHVFGFLWAPLRPATCCWRKGRSWRKAPITSMPLLGNQGSVRRNMENIWKYGLESPETWGKEAQEHILNCWIIFTASLALWSQDISGKGVSLASLLGCTSAQQTEKKRGLQPADLPKENPDK